ncbi:hypothetical protein B0H14DRAFT_2559347 [Mycena olivaceomarginata]|nr:hypothetical protein B0H14DRAFT_2559347 [Mycena olivaceomarginata]
MPRGRNTALRKGRQRRIAAYAKHLPVPPFDKPLGLSRGSPSSQPLPPTLLLCMPSSPSIHPPPPPTASLCGGRIREDDPGPKRKGARNTWRKERERGLGAPNKEAHRKRGVDRDIQHPVYRHKKPSQRDAVARRISPLLHKTRPSLPVPVCKKKKKKEERKPPPSIALSTSPRHMKMKHNSVKGLWHRARRIQRVRFHPYRARQKEIGCNSSKTGAPRLCAPRAAACSRGAYAPRPRIPHVAAGRRRLRSDPMHQAQRYMYRRHPHLDNPVGRKEGSVGAGAGHPKHASSSWLIRGGERRNIDDPIEKKRAGGRKRRKLAARAVPRPTSLHPIALRSDSSARTSTEVCRDLSKERKQEGRTRAKAKLACPAAQLHKIEWSGHPSTRNAMQTEVQTRGQVNRAQTKPPEANRATGFGGTELELVADLGSYVIPVERVPASLNSCRTSPLPDLNFESSRIWIMSRCEWAACPWYSHFGLLAISHEPRIQHQASPAWGGGGSSSSSGHRPSPTAVNNHTEEEDEDDLYEEPPDDDLEDKGEEGEDGLEGEGVGEDGAAARATGGQRRVLGVGATHPFRVTAMWAAGLDRIDWVHSGEAGLVLCCSPFPQTKRRSPTSILTVTDNLLKNDGRKFLEMMEQLEALRARLRDRASGIAPPGSRVGPGRLNFDWPMKRRPWGVLVGDERMPFTAMFTQQQQPMSPRTTARHPNAVRIPANASEHGHGVGAVGQFDPSTSTMLYHLPPTILSLPAAKYEYTEEGDKCTLALAPRARCQRPHGSLQRLKSLYEMICILSYSPLRLAPALHLSFSIPFSFIMPPSFSGPEFILHYCLYG